MLGANPRSSPARQTWDASSITSRKATPCASAAAPDQVPPRTYTYVDISDHGIVVPDGACYCFGYDVTGLGGQVEFSGVETWSWYSGYWDLDAGWGRTALLQIRADFAPTATFGSSWSGIQSLY